MDKATKTFFYRGLKITVDVSEPAAKQARAVGNRTAGVKPGESTESQSSLEYAYKAGPFYSTFRGKTWTIKCTEFRKLSPSRSVRTHGQELQMSWAGWGAFSVIAEERYIDSNGVALIYPCHSGCYFKLFEYTLDARQWYEKNAYSGDAYVLLF